MTITCRSLPEGDRFRGRRHFLKAAGALSAGAVLGRALPAGHGRLDYDRYVSLLHACGFKGPLLLHGLSESQVPGCAAFLRKKLAGPRSD